MLFDNLRALFETTSNKNRYIVIFCHIDGSPLTYYQFNQVLKKSLSFFRLDVTTFKSHSFRIGAATYLYMQGAPEQEIKAKGRWHSNAFESYIQ